MSKTIQQIGGGESFLYPETQGDSGPFLSYPGLQFASEQGRLEIELANAGQRGTAYEFNGSLYFQEAE